MNAITEITSDYISKAVTQVKKIKPDYLSLLELYEKIFIAQEEARKLVRLQDYRIPDDVLALKFSEKFPMVEISQFAIDGESAGRLFRTVCDILLAAGKHISENIIKIRSAVENGSLSTERLFSAMIMYDESFLKTIEEEFAIDREVLRFVAYNSMKPSLVMFSEMVSSYLDRENEWEKGYCPVCGSMPELSVFDVNGKRSFVCSFCAHEWPSRRVYCSFCENTDHDTLRYYEIEDEEEYRVDVCDRCKRYIKTVDINKTSRPLYLPLEKISTPYIDLKFKEMGYIPGNIPVAR